MQRRRGLTDSRSGRRIVPKVGARLASIGCWVGQAAGRLLKFWVAHRRGDIRNNGCTDGCPFRWHRDQAPAWQGTAACSRWLYWPRQPHHECCRSARDRRHGLPRPLRPRGPRRERAAGWPSLARPVEAARAAVSVAASGRFAGAGTAESTPAVGAWTVLSGVERMEMVGPQAESPIPIPWSGWRYAGRPLWV